MATQPIQPHSEGVTTKVVAIYADPRAAKRVAKTLVKRDNFAREDVWMNLPEENAALDMREKSREANEAMVGPAFAVTRMHARGMVTGGLPGLIVGAGLGALIGWMAFGSTVGLVASIVAGAAFGTWAGVLLGGYMFGDRAADRLGGRSPERMAVHVRVRGDDQAEQAEDTLRAMNPQRVERIRQGEQRAAEIQQRRDTGASDSA